MAKEFLISLFYNVILISFVIAYRNDAQLKYLDLRKALETGLQVPTNDLNHMDFSKKDVKDKFFSDLENWTGRWMPDNDPQPTIAPVINSLDNNIPVHHSIPMGNTFPDCDDGKTRLDIDWDKSPVNYTCYGGKITPSYAITALKYCEHIPRSYTALHRCMNQTIEYDDDIPLYGTHRPVWPVYGEYKFLPRQRWIHSLEHGAVVMLYHPCANPLEVQLLKDTVRKCLRRHIITRYNLLDIQRPIALVTWGCRLTMSYVDHDLVMNFIHEKALHGPENIEDDGDFVEGLLKVADIVSDNADSKLCPSFK